MEGYKGISRRGFLKGVAAGVCFSIFDLFHRAGGSAAAPVNPIFCVKDIPDDPFYEGGNYHEGVDALLNLMGNHSLKFYRSGQETALSGPSGMFEPDDIVLIKVNAQWKYRGSTNSDLIRGLIQRILDHPDGFVGEVVIIENGQSQGSLNGDALGWGSYPDNSVHANANDESHSFNYLVNTIFHDPRVSSYLLDPIRTTLPLGANDHTTQGYRIYENLSYPCFTTAGGHRVELREGLWQGNGYSQNLKLINVPVLKHHDTGGSEITASLKHFYGVVSMSDGNSGFRHYSGLGETCGKMMVSVRTPILNMIDAIWVSHASISGYPAAATFRANQIVASQDPVALDYWAAKNILYPIDSNPRHHPDFPGIDAWLTSARDTINSRGGLHHPDFGIFIDQVTKNEGEMVAYVAVSNPPVGPDLNGLWTTPVIQACRNTRQGPRCRISGILTIDNVGDRDAFSSKVVFYLSDNDTYEEDDTLLMSRVTGKIKAGKRKAIRLAYNLPMGQTATGKYVIAVIDKYNSVAEVRESNNIAVFGPVGE